MTGWLSYTPENEDLLYWGMLPIGANHRVALWPQPGSLRVDARYRMRWGKDCQPSAQRFLVRIRHNKIADPPTADTKDRWAVIDLEPISGGHIEGTTDPNPDGVVLRMSAESMDVLPDQGVPGVLCEIEISISGQGSVIYWEEFRNDAGNTNWVAEVENWLSGGNAKGWIVDPLWTLGSYTQQFQAASECYPFERQSGLDPGFAEFNGVDSYIALSTVTDSWALPFRVTCEFRKREMADWMPILGKIVGGGFFGMERQDFVWGNIRRTTSWLPVIDDWLTWRLDFEQAGQLRWQLYIDEILVMDQVVGRQSSNANALGVWRQSEQGGIFGHFDLRNLKYVKGTVGSFTTVLDMPLQVNALDAGPQANHGTTFNMDLPSI